MTHGQKLLRVSRAPAARQCTVALAISAAISATSVALATPGGIGLSQLNTLNPSITGAGVNVAQVEASMHNPPPPDLFEVNPAYVGQPVSKFTYIDYQGNTTTTYSSANYSSHASAVGADFYGTGTGTDTASGVAPGVATISNYDAGSFAGNNIGLTENAVTQMLSPTTNQNQTANNAAVINQSFIFGIPTSFTPAQGNTYIQNIDWGYDSYVNKFNTIIVSAVGNYPTAPNTTPASFINPPATAYNSIAVGSYNGGPNSTEVGPTFDGRSKPDIVAPGSETSYATPLVSGAAALLVQAGNVGIGYAPSSGWTQSTYQTNSVQAQTIKAFLLNGAVQPAGWHHTATAPLDTHYGAGVLNVYNAYQNLAAGRVGFSATNTSTTALDTPTITQGTGWDYETLLNNGPVTLPNPTTFVDHYVFTALAGGAGSSDSFKATLVWNAQTNSATFTEKQTPIFLELYNAATGSLVSESVSTVDNVQQVDAVLTPGTNYDLQVLTSGGNFVAQDPFALAFSTTVNTPEPSGIALLGVAAGLCAMVALRQRFRRA